MKNEIWISPSAGTKVWAYTKISNFSPTATTSNSAKHKKKKKKVKHFYSGSDWFTSAPVSQQIRPKIEGSSQHRLPHSTACAPHMCRIGGGGGDRLRRADKITDNSDAMVPCCRWIYVLGFQEVSEPLQLECRRFTRLGRFNYYHGALPELMENERGWRLKRVLTEFQNWLD